MPLTRALTTQPQAVQSVLKVMEVQNHYVAVCEEIAATTATTTFLCCGSSYSPPQALFGLVGAATGYSALRLKTNVDGSLTSLCWSRSIDANTPEIDLSLLAQMTVVFQDETRSISS